MTGNYVFDDRLRRLSAKNEVAAIRELWGLKNGEHILHMAHRTTTSRSALERLKLLLDDAHIKHKDSSARVRKSSG